jgi:hypothetical protein
MRSRRPRTPCAHRLGERTRRQRLGRVMSSRDAIRQPPGLPCRGRETRVSLLANRVSARTLEAPRAFHGLDELDDGPNIIAGHHHRGARAGLATFTRPSTLAARRMTDDPVRVSAFSVARLRVLAGPRGLPSSTSPRCLEIRFYNRRYASRAPAETSPSETVRQAPVGKPAGARLPGSPSIPAFPPIPRATLDHLAVIQPPTAARLTACCRLRAVSTSHASCV